MLHALIIYIMQIDQTGDIKFRNFGKIILGVTQIIQITRSITPITHLPVNAYHLFARKPTLHYMFYLNRFK